MVDLWRRRGWLGLVNVMPQALCLAAAALLPAVTGWHDRRLGLLVAGAAALCGGLGLLRDRRVLGGLPVDSVRLTLSLHGAVALFSTLPLLLAAPWGLEMTQVMPLWLLGLAVGQLWLPWSLNRDTLPWLARLGFYGGVLVWTLLLVREIYDTPFRMIETVLPGGDGASPTSAADLSPAAVLAGGILLTTCCLSAMRSTWLNLTRDGGRGPGGMV